jgi:tripartite-type tricarboxylate transporter receptor subunit TctC
MNTKALWKRIALAALIGCSCASQAAETYPDRAINITVPTAPGGTVDIVARIMSDKLAEILGQAVVVNNKPGAGGVIGTQALLREKADGYNVLFTANSNQLIVPWVYKNVTFDPLKDFKPIAAVGMVPNVLVVNPSFPANNLKEFIDVVKAQPGKYQYASAGAGTLNHLLGEMLNTQGGMDLQHIPYRGVAPAMTDVLGNQVPMLFASLPSAISNIQSGKLRPLGISSKDRQAVLPDVPAIGEQIPGFSGDLWVAFYAGADTPQFAVDKLHSAIAKALASKEITEKFAQMGVTALNDGPSELAKRQEGEFLMWKKIVEASGAAVK